MVAATVNRTGYGSVTTISFTDRRFNFGGLLVFLYHFDIKLGLLSG